MNQQATPIATSRLKASRSRSAIINVLSTANPTGMAATTPAIAMSRVRGRLAPFVALAEVDRYGDAPRHPGELTG